MDSLQSLCVLTEGLFGYSREPTLIFPQVPGRTFFPNLSKCGYLCSGPISVDPICPQPTRTEQRIGSAREALFSDGFIVNICAGMKVVPIAAIFGARTEIVDAERPRAV